MIKDKIERGDIVRVDDGVAGCFLEYCVAHAGEVDDVNRGLIVLNMDNRDHYYSVPIGALALVRKGRTLGELHE